MKRDTIILFSFLSLLFFTCKNDAVDEKLSQVQELNTPSIPVNNNQPEKDTKFGQKIDCNSLQDKKVIFEIATFILNKHDNDQIWNLSEIDTTDFFTTEDYFTNSKTKNRLVLIGGSAGMSSGSADNLLILLACSNSLNIIWSGQVGDFTLTDIADLNCDGIKEIVVKASAMWMGECYDSYNIFNFKEDKQNYIYKAHSTSVIECGRDDLSEIYKKGDTLENMFDCSLIKINDKNFKVQQIKTTKIHNGGKTGDEVLKKLKVIVDTTNVKLKQ